MSRAAVLALLLLASCTATNGGNRTGLISATESSSFPGDHIPLKSMRETLPGDHLPLRSLLPPGSHPRVPSDRGDAALRIAGESRPEVFGSHPVDYQALPLASVTTVRGADAATFTVASMTGLTPDIRFSEKIVGQVEIGVFRGVSRTPLGPPMTGAANPCGASSYVSGKSATWEGIVRSTWSESEIDYVRHEGTFEGGPCKGVARRSVRVRAKAIIPSLLYAYRECVGSCGATAKADSGKVASEEMLVLIGPPSSWLTSNAPWPSEQLIPHVGVLSRARVPLGRGSSASVLMNTSHWVVRNFVARYDGTPDAPESARARVMQLGFDAVWPSEEATPNGLAFLAAVTSGNLALLESLGVSANPY